MKAWVEHYVRLLNVEFEWSSDSLPEVAPVADPPLACQRSLSEKLSAGCSLSRLPGPLVYLLKC